MDRIFLQGEILKACESGHMGMELTFVPRGAYTIPGDRGVAQAWSTDYGSENICTFRMIGRDGDQNVWQVDEVIQPFFLRVLRKVADSRSDRQKDLFEAWKRNRRVTTVCHCHGQ